MFSSLFFSPAVSSRSECLSFARRRKQVSKLIVSRKAFYTITHIKGKGFSSPLSFCGKGGNMKRLLLTLSCIISVIWLFPCFVKAYTQTDFNLKVLEETDITCGTYSNDVYQYLTEHPTYPFTIEKYSSFIKFVVGSSYTQGTYDYQYEYPSPYYIFQIYYNSNKVGTSVYNTNLFQTYYGNTTDSYVVGQWQNIDEFLVTTDYDTVYYSPLIPNVDFSVVLNTSGVPVNDINNTIYNAFNVNINSDVGNNYYIQIGYKAHIPNKMALGVNNNGTAYYTSLTFNDAAYQNVYSLQDNQVAFTGSVNNALFTWTRQAVPSESWTVAGNLQGNTSFINGSISAYNDTMSYVMPLYGKKLEIFMRYFVIQDNQVIVGAWSHWNNNYPYEYTQELPANYIPYHDIPGYKNTDSDVNLENQNNTISSVGSSTGTTVSVYNNTVPNYPNYPTIVSYNHDNVLTQMIDTTKKLPSFFGDFTDFCKITLSFIPSEVWEIVAFGFLCSILIMIVKVL